MNPPAGARNFNEAVARRPLPQARPKRAVGRKEARGEAGRNVIIARPIVAHSPYRASDSPASGADTDIARGKGTVSRDGRAAVNQPRRTDRRRDRSEQACPAAKSPGHVQLNCRCRPTSSAHKSVRGDNSRPTPCKPRPHNAAGVQDRVIDSGRFAWPSTPFSTATATAGGRRRRGSRSR